jgi:hypothetical protein
MCWALILVVCLSSRGLAIEPGKEVMGTVLTELVFATNGSLEGLGARGKELSKAEEGKLRASDKLKFKSYRRLGSDRRPVWRAFENWSLPMKPSEEVMVSFEPKGQVGKDALRLDLKLWLQRREVLAALPILKKGQKLYILGPNWRGGRLIIGIELVDLQK